MTPAPLAWLPPAPREVTSELIERLDPTLARPMWFAFWSGGRKGWEEDLKSSEFRWGSIVQANGRLFDPSTAKTSPAVHIYTSDPRAVDHDWATDFFRGIHEHLYDGTCPKTAGLLSSAQSTFINHAPDPAATGGVLCKMSVNLLSPARLPGGFIPEDRILPALWCPRNDSFRIVHPRNYAAAPSATLSRRG